MSEFTRGPANVTQLMTFAMEKMGKNLNEQWLNSYAVTKKLKSAKNIVKEEEGGRVIVRDIEYASNSSVDFVSATDVLSTADDEIATQAQFSWAILAGSLTVKDHDLAKASGKYQRYAYVATKLNNLRNSFTKKLENKLVNSTTAATKDIWSLLDIVDASDPSIANLGDIDRDTYTWWASTEVGSGGSMATGGLENVRTAFYTASRGTMDPCDLHLTTQSVYEGYHNRLLPQERLAPGDKGDLEIASLAFLGKPVVYSEDMSSGVWIGLATKHLELHMNTAMNFKQQPWTRAPGGQSQTAVVQTMLQLVPLRPASFFKVTGLSK